MQLKVRVMEGRGLPDASWHCKLTLGGADKAKTTAVKGSEPKWDELVTLTTSVKTDVLRVELVRAKTMGSKSVAELAIGLPAMQSWTRGEPHKVLEQLSSGGTLLILVTPVDFGAPAAASAAATTTTSTVRSPRSRPLSPRSGSADAPLAMPPPEEVNRLYAALMESLGLGKDFQNPTEVQTRQMASMSVENKWAMICSNQHIQTKEAGKVEETSQYWKAKLAGQEMNDKELSKLHLILSGKSLTWLEEFCDGGLAPLFELVAAEGGSAGAAAADAVDAAAANSEAFRCVRVLLNNKVGLESLVRTPSALRILTASLGSPECDKLLLAVCVFSSSSHRALLAALSELGRAQGTPHRFSRLVQLFDEAPLDDKERFLSLINALTNYPDDLDVRVALRNEFQQLNLDTIVAALKEELMAQEKITQLDLETQITVFEEEKLGDETELTDRFAELDVDVSRPDDVWRALCAMSKEHGLWSNLMAAVQNMLLVPVATQDGLARFLLMCRIVRQISLNKGEIGKHDDVNLHELLAAVETETKEVPLRRRIEQLEAEAEASAKALASLKIEVEEKSAKLSQESAKLSQMAPLELKLAESLEKIKILESLTLESQITRAESTARLNVSMRSSSADLSADGGARPRMSSSKLALSLVGAEAPQDDADATAGAAPTDDEGGSASQPTTAGAEPSTNEPLADDAGQPAPASATDAAAAESSPLGAALPASAENQAHVEALRSALAAQPDVMAHLDALLASMTVAPPQPSPAAEGGGAPAEPESAAPPPPAPPMPGATEGGGSAPPPPAPPPPGGAAVSGGGPPPPPPPPGGSAPPAPGGGPPPPPPMSKPKRQPLQKPSAKTKQLQWVKLPPLKMKGTVFEQLTEQYQGPVKLDYDALENSFKAKVIAKKAAAADGEEDGQPKSPRDQLVQLLDPKTHQNLSIFLAQFKQTTFASMAQAIDSLDASVFSLAQLKSMLHMVPSKDEVAGVAGFLESGGDAARLGEPEKFLLALGAVEMYEEKINALIFMASFESRKADIKPELQAVTQAAEQLLTSPALVKMFEFILEIGNFLNIGTPRGGIHGFKLDSLAKLGDTKSTDNTMTLQMFAVQLLLDADAEGQALLQFAKELPSVDKAARVSVPTVLEDLKSLERDFKAAQTALNRLDYDDGSTVRKFMSNVHDDMEQMREAVAQFEDKYKEVCQYFGENEKTMASDELFGKFAQFARACQASTEALVKAKNEKERAARRAEAQNARIAKSKRSSRMPPPGAESGVVDELLMALKGGNMFKNRRSQQTSLRTSARLPQ